MWKRALTSLLITGSMYGQTISSDINKEPCADKGSIPTGPGISVFERHDRLRKGRAEDFALVLCSPQHKYGGCPAVPHPPQTGVVPMSFNIDLPRGITMQYRDGRKFRPLASGESISYRPGSKVLLLRVITADDVPIGIQKLHGTLIAQRMEPGKTVRTDQIPVDFRVVITTHDDKVYAIDWRFGNQVGGHAKDVAMAPLLPFQYLLLWIGCGFSNCDL